MKIERNATGYFLTNQAEYVYDGLRVIQERNASNVPTVSYTRGVDLAGPLSGGDRGGLEGAGGIGGLLARSDGYSAGNWTNHAYYFADGNGNVTFMLNSGQSVVARYRYDPFGNTISSGGSLAAVNLYRFSSKEFHVNSGMYYYGYRWYSPSLQRWLNRDPIDDAGFRILASPPFSSTDTSENGYTYVINDPQNRTDPSGLQFGPGNGDGQCDVDKCKDRCHKWADALAKQGGFNAAKALLKCFEGCDRDSKYIPGNPLPPLPTLKPTAPKEPLWPLMKSCAKLGWEWCKGKRAKNE